MAAAFILGIILGALLIGFPAGLRLAKWGDLKFWLVFVEAMRRD